MAVRRCDQPASNDWYILPQLLCYYIHYLGILGNEKVCGHRVTVPQRGCSCPEPLRGEKAGGAILRETPTHRRTITKYLFGYARLLKLPFVLPVQTGRGYCWQPRDILLIRE